MNIDSRQLRQAIEDQREKNRKTLCGNSSGRQGAAFSNDVCHVVEQLIDLMESQHGSTVNSEQKG